MAQRFVTAQRLPYQSASPGRPLIRRVVAEAKDANHGFCRVEVDALISPVLRSRRDV